MAKGVAYNMLEVVRFALLTAIVIVVVLTLVATVIRQQSDARLSELNVYANLLLYADGGIRIQDEHTGRSVPLSVDAQRFDDATLTTMLGNTDNRFVGGRLFIEDEKGDTYEAYLNKQWYQTYVPLANQDGSGATTLLVKTRQILLQTASGERRDATLTLQLVVPR